VFDRDEQYDPRIDSIVRVEAGRLRTKIDEHYNGAGAADAVLIRIPRGTYAPVFERRPSAPAAPAVPVDALSRPRRRTASGRVLAALWIAILLTVIVAWRTSVADRPEKPAPSITIAVLPFSSYSTDPADQMLAARLTEGVTGELARIGTIGVVSHTSALQFAGVHRSLREIAQALDADIVVEASVETVGDQVHIQARLVNASVDRKGFVQDLEGLRTELPDLQRRVAEAIASAAPRRRNP